MGASDDLQVSEQIGERLRVATDASTTLHHDMGRPNERRLREGFVEVMVPRVLQLTRIGCDTARDERFVDRVAFEQLAGESPELVDCRLRSGVALRGAVAEPDDPRPRVTQVIRGLLL